MTSQVQPDLRDQLSELFKPGWVVNEDQGDQDVQRIQDSGITLLLLQMCAKRSTPSTRQKGFLKGEPALFRKPYNTSSLSLPNAAL